MSLIHRATLTPSKTDFLAAWVPTQAWCPPSRGPIETIGAFRFDDPESQVGIETHLVRVGGVTVQVPLTYREAPLGGAEHHLAGTIEHSVLGTRWVYDAIGDPIYLVMLAAVAMTGQGESLGMAKVEGRWHIAPSNVRIRGGGWTTQRVSVDQLERANEDPVNVVFRNDGFTLRFFRQPVVEPRPPLGLAATWAGQADAVLLATVTPEPLGTFA